MPKKPAATGSNLGSNDPYMQIFVEFRLKDSDATWMRKAKCRGRKDITWFPEPGEAHLMMEAKKFCGNCRVLKRCLEYALVNEISYGVWGGKSATERKKLAQTGDNKDILWL